MFTRPRRGVSNNGSNNGDRDGIRRGNVGGSISQRYDGSVSTHGGFGQLIGSIICILVVAGFLFIAATSLASAMRPRSSQQGVGTPIETSHVRGARPLQSRPDPSKRVVIPLPYGSELPFTDDMVHRAVEIGLSSTPNGVAYTGPASPGSQEVDRHDWQWPVVVPPEYRGQTAVAVERVVGGGVINAVYRVVLSGGAAVFVKLGSPFWRGCGKSLSEAAVQRYVRAHTAIPVPRVLAASKARWVLASDGKTPVEDVVVADAKGIQVQLDLPDFIIVEVAPGRKLKDELRRPNNEVPRAVREAYIREWVGVFKQLQELRFGRYGSFSGGSATQRGMDVTALSTNGGCSGLGPFRTYEEYAGARVEMFIPLIAGGACAGPRFNHLVPRLQCLATRFAQPPTKPRHRRGGFPGKRDPLQPVLLHTDLSVRNILVDDDVEGGGPRVTGVLDWEFAVAGPAEEEFTFDATLERISAGDKLLFQQVAKEMGVFPISTTHDGTNNQEDVVAQQQDEAARRDHVAAYWSLNTFCHAHAWKNDPTFTPAAREEAYHSEEMKMIKLLHKYGC